MISSILAFVAAFAAKKPEPESTREQVLEAALDVMRAANSQLEGERDAAIKAKDEAEAYIAAANRERDEAQRHNSYLRDRIVALNNDLARAQIRYEQVVALYAGVAPPNPGSWRPDLGHAVADPGHRHENAHMAMRRQIEAFRAMSPLPERAAGQFQQDAMLQAQGIPAVVGADGIARLPEWGFCNCVPARHDMLTGAGQANMRGTRADRIIVDDPHA
jgi:hypothetical protein